MDLTEAEVMKKRWQEYIEELYKNDLNNPDNHNGVITYLCEVKWALGRITRNKAFLSDQCKEIEGNNRMSKTRDVFKKIRDTKGTFHAKMSTIKDRNSLFCPLS